MKKIYILLLLSALTFQSAVAQNEQPNPYQVAKKMATAIARSSNCSIWTAPLSARSLNIPITTC